MNFSHILIITKKPTISFFHTCSVYIKHTKVMCDQYSSYYKHTMASIEGSAMVDYSIQLVWHAVVFTDKILGKIKTVMNNKGRYYNSEQYQL